MVILWEVGGCARRESVSLPWEYQLLDTGDRLVTVMMSIEGQEYETWSEYDRCGLETSLSIKLYLQKFVSGAVPWLE